jgi:hypothetical protein
MPRAKPKQIQTNFRTTTAMRESLQAAADAHGVSINREINDRLARSFEDHPSIEQDFFSRELYGIVRLIAVAMNDAGRFAALIEGREPESTNDWPNRPFAFSQAVRAAIYVLRALRPPGKWELPRYRGADRDSYMKRFLQTIGRRHGEVTITEALQGGPIDSHDDDLVVRRPALIERTRRLHNDLGPLADRLKAFAESELKSTPIPLGGQK